jgi:hypothetical protein
LQGASQNKALEIMQSPVMRVKRVRRCDATNRERLGAAQTEVVRCGQALSNAYLRPEWKVIEIRARCICIERRGSRKNTLTEDAPEPAHRIGTDAGEMQ